MGRLIDADALIKEYPQASGLKLVIENAPTAYDVDKVVEEAEKESKWVAYNNWDRDIGMTHKVVPFGKFEEIVRKGGVNE